MPVIDAHSHIYPDKIACKASSAVGDFYGVDMNAKNASAVLDARGVRGLAHHSPPGAFRGHDARARCRSSTTSSPSSAAPTTTSSASLPCIKISKTWKARSTARLSWD